MNRFIYANVFLTDLRTPVGLMFLVLGAILTGYGLLRPADVAPRDPGIQVDAVWGIVICFFGSRWRLREARRRSVSCKLRRFRLILKLWPDHGLAALYVNLTSPIAR